MNDRRRRNLRTLPSGAVLDEDAYRWMLSMWADRAPARVTVRRLSLSDPAIAAFEATSRGSRVA